MVTEMVTLPNVVFFVLLKKDIHVGKSEKFDFGVNYPFKYFPLPVCTRKWQVLQHVKTHMSSVTVAGILSLTKAGTTGSTAQAIHFSEHL